MFIKRNPEKNIFVDFRLNVRKHTCQRQANPIYGVTKDNPNLHLLGWSIENKPQLRNSK